jgi:hypothetical protein
MIEKLRSLSLRIAKNLITYQLLSVRATATPEIHQRSVTDACGVLAGDPKSIFILQYKCY